MHILTLRQAAVYLVASQTRFQARFFCSGLKRNLPIGGSAKGIPCRKKMYFSPKTLFFKYQKNCGKN
jgi:hypothetical protein